MRRTRLALGAMMCFVVCGQELAVPAPTNAEKGVQMVKTAYKGWSNCYRLTNGEIELIATGDVGPRVIRLGFVNEDNVFGEDRQQVGQTGGQQWRIYGGHRLWHAPEAKPRTYFPDNFPIQVKAGKNSLTLVQPTETTTGIQKIIELTMDVERNHVAVRHVLRNQNLWTVELAPWALTMMAQRGFAVIPQPPYVSHQEQLLPVRPLAQWAYLNMADPRWRWGKRYITLRQDPDAAEPQKLGVGNQENWVAYAVKDYLFIKTFRYHDAGGAPPGATYPDFGCSTEVFTNADMLELETLGPMTSLQPGAAVDYIEHWFLFKGAKVANDDAAIDAVVMPKVRAALEASAPRRPRRR
jgi:hypothetical protein